MIARRCGLLFAALLVSLPLQAERYALLVGISNYQAGGINLEGPRFDVTALSDLLVEHHGYRAANVTILADQQATRENTLNALRAKVDGLQAGDDLLFYFSGHGTSAFDIHMQQLSPEIGPNSGALVPYDLDLTSLRAVVGTLIIGRRDLRPILSKVPPGAQAFVVLDACYSENSMKAAGVLATAPVRGVNIAARLRDRDQQAGPSTNAAEAAPASESEPYPYANVVAFSAASKNQAALDIGSQLLSQNWHTVDGHPHGALTNSLLAGLAGAADTNHDGSITYDELFRFIRRDMEKFPHQPQMLAPAGFAEKRAFHTPGIEFQEAVAAPGTGPRSAAPTAAGSTERGFARLVVPAGTTGAPAPKVRVRIEGATLGLLSELAAMPEVEVGTGAYDLLVRRAGKQWEISDVSGVLVQSLPGDDVSAVAARVRAEGRLAELRRWSNARQDFNVKIDVEPASGVGYERLRSVLRVGESANFRIGTERAAYLLLLEINKNGRVSVLFPGADAAERAPQTARRPVEFGAQITPPAGSDELKLIGFIEAPRDWADWACTDKACPEFGGDDPRMERLLQMLRTSYRTAETSLRVITQQ